MLTQLLTNQALYDLLYTIITGVFATACGVAVKRANDFARTHLSAKHYEFARTVTVDVVKQVEQDATKYGWSSRQKYAQAAMALTRIGDEHGLDLTDEQWQSLLEATVREVTGAAHTVAPVEGAAP